MREKRTRGERKGKGSHTLSENTSKGEICVRRWEKSEVHGDWGKGKFVGKEHWKEGEYKVW